MSPQHQGLLDGDFETVVALFGVAVLVGMLRLRALRTHPHVGQKRFVASREVRLRLLLGRLLRVVCPPQVDDRGGEAVGAMLSGNAPQLPQRVLQPFGQCLKALGEAQRAGLPVGVREHEVVEHVIQRLALDADAQRRQMGEVGGAENAGMMYLREHHLAPGPLRGAPELDAPLQRAQLPVLPTTGELSLQVLQESVGVQTGVDLEHLRQLGPDIGERICARRPVMRAHTRAGHAAHVPPLAGRLHIHAGLGGGRLKGLGVPDL